MKTWISLLLSAAVFGLASLSADDSVHDFTVKDITGKDVALKDYEGKALLIVNVASKCGKTYQYDNMQRLHQKFADKGLVVMGFPANNYGRQEPGTDMVIKEFCEANFAVTFPMFSKVSVDGDDQAELFKYLTTAENQDFTGPIKWNFEKFLVGKDGKVLRRFRSGEEPDSSTVVAAVEEALED